MNARRLPSLGFCPAAPINAPDSAGGRPMKHHKGANK
jgi:hypothetical protein